MNIADIKALRPKLEARLKSLRDKRDAAKNNSDCTAIAEFTKQIHNINNIIAYIFDILSKVNSTIMVLYNDKQYSLGTLNLKLRQYNKELSWFLKHSKDIDISDSQFYIDKLNRESKNIEKIISYVYNNYTVDCPRLKLI